VSLSQSNGNITWVPLSPDEVRYPTTLSSGFTLNRWDTYFSVPVVAAYCPAPAPSYTTHYSTNYYTDLYIAQPCYSYWGTPIIKTVHIYKGPVTIINKRRGYQYPGRVKNIYKGPVVIINPPPRNNGKSHGRGRGQSANHGRGNSTKNAATNPIIPVNVQSGGASSTTVANFGKSHSHRRAASSDVAHMSRKRLSLLALQQDRFVTPEASALAPGLLHTDRSKKNASKPSEAQSQRTDGQERQSGKDKAQGPVPAMHETLKNNATQPRVHQERVEAKRPNRNPTESNSPKREAQDRSQQKHDDRVQERTERQEHKDKRRETQQNEENQPQQPQEQERREREERAQRELQEREAKQAREEEHAERERQAKERKQQQEEQERERRQAEQQNNSQPASDGGAYRPGRNGRRRDR
jgi:hypothetical protein